jgi:hypothetical protein
MNNTYFPAIEHYPYIDATSEMMFFPKSPNRKRHKGGIDSLPRKINFQDLLDWIEDNITFPSTSTNFSITDGTTTSVINNGETITFQDGTGVNFTVTGNTVSAALVSASVPNIYTQNGTIDDALRTVSGGGNAIFWTSFSAFAVVTPTSFSVSNAGALTLSSTANASLTAAGTLQLNGAASTVISGTSISLTTGAGGSLVLTTPDGATNSIVQYSLLQAQNATGTVEFTPYAFPAADGTSGQILSTNGSGVLFWGTPTATNLFTSDLTLGANRTHELDGFEFNMVSTAGAASRFHVEFNNGASFNDFKHAVFSTQLRTGDATDASQIFIQKDSIRIESSGEIIIGNNSKLSFEESYTLNPFPWKKISFSIPATLTASVDFILPDGDGTVGQVLSTDGAANLSWVSLTADTNLFNVDLTLAANRTHQLDNFDFHFTGADGEVHIYLTSVPDYGELIVNKTGVYMTADDSTDSSILQVMNTGRINMTASQGIRVNGATSSTVSELRFYEASTNGTSYIGLSASTALSASVSFKLPNADGVSGQLISTNGTGGLSFAYPEEAIIIACSDETTALTTGTAKVTFRMPYKFSLRSVKACVTTAPTGAVLTVDINEGGVSILSTKLTIDISEKTSTTAATPAVISDTALSDDAEITIDIDTVGSTVAGAGLKVYLIGNRVP